MQENQKIIAVLPEGRFFDRVYSEVIAGWAAGQGTASVRVRGDNANVGNLCGEIEKAGLVLADLSGRNPSGAYAAGYAQGIGRRVIFLAQVETDFPFAVGSQRLIVYSGNLDFLRAELDRIEGGGSSPAAASATGARARFDELFGEILRAHAHQHKGEIEMENAQTFVLLNQEMDLALVQDLSRRARELGVRLKLM